MPDWPTYEGNPLRRLFNGEILARILAPRRLLLLGVIFALEAFLLIGFASQPLSQGELQTYSTTLNDTRSLIGTVPPSTQVLLIFANNARVALVMLTPILGQIAFLGSLYNTAHITEVIAAQLGVSPARLILGLYLLPHTWIELSVYAFASKEGLYIIAAAARGGRRNFDIGRLESELFCVPLVLVLMGAILMVAAIFEVGEGLAGSPTGFLFWIPFAAIAAATLGVIRRLHLLSRTPASS